MAGADTAFTLDERDYGFLRCRSFVSSVPRPSTKRGFVCLDEHALAAERTAGLIVAHGFAYAMPDEPTSFEIDAEHAAELICAEALLATPEQMHRLQPDVHGDMAFLKDGSDLDGERLAAGVALVDADPGALALQQPAITDRAAMWAHAPIWPDDRLDVSVGSVFVAETGFVEDGAWHRLSP